MKPCRLEITEYFIVFLSAFPLLTSIWSYVLPLLGKDVAGGVLCRCATIATAASYQTEKQWWSPNLTFWLCYLRLTASKDFSYYSQSFLVVFFIAFSRGSIDDLKEGHLPQLKRSSLNSPVVFMCKERAVPVSQSALLIILQQFYLIWYQTRLSLSEVTIFCLFSVLAVFCTAWSNFMLWKFCIVSVF